MANGSGFSAEQTEHNLPLPFRDRQQEIVITLIRGLNEGAFMERLVGGAQRMAAGLGVRLIELEGNGEQAAMSQLVAEAIQQGVHGIIVSHGVGELLLPAVRLALDAGIRVVSIDTVIDHSAVPEIEQDDLAIGLLIGKSLALRHNGEARVIYINDDVYAPLVKRDRLWQDVKWRYSGLYELTQIRSVTSTAMVSTTQALGAALRDYPEANVVLAMWNELANGALDAIEQAGQGERIEVYGVDCTDADIQRMVAPGSPWVATVATDAAAMGRLAVRTLAALLAGEAVPKYLLVEPVLITQEFLRAGRIGSMDELVRALPTLAESEFMWFNWMELLLERNGQVMPLLNTRVVEALRETEASLRVMVAQQRQLIDTITELSTPVVPVHDHILILPLIGTIDSRRSTQIMDSLLASVQQHQAYFVIIDITGVPLVDTAVAGHLMQAIRAVKLLGAECVIVGVSPEIAQTIIGLGIDVQGLTARGTMQDGIAYALARQGLRQRAAPQP